MKSDPRTRFASIEESRPHYACMFYVTAPITLVCVMLALAHVRGELPQVWAYAEDAWVPVTPAAASSVFVPADAEARPEAACPPPRSLDHITELEAALCQRLVDRAGVGLKPAVLTALGALHFVTCVPIPVRRGPQIRKFTVCLFRNALLLVAPAPRVVARPRGFKVYPAVQSVFALAWALVRGSYRSARALGLTVMRSQSGQGCIRLDEDEKGAVLEKGVEEANAGILPPEDGRLQVKRLIILKQITRVSDAVPLVLTVTAGVELPLELVFGSVEEVEAAKERLRLRVRAAGGELAQGFDLTISSHLTLFVILCRCMSKVTM